MGDLTSIISTLAMNPTGTLLVVGLLMGLRVARALQRAPISSRRPLGTRARPTGL